MQGTKHQVIDICYRYDQGESITDEEERFLRDTAVEQGIFNSYNLPIQEVCRSIFGKERKRPREKYETPSFDIQPSKIQRVTTPVVSTPIEIVSFEQWNSLPRDLQGFILQMVKNPRELSNVCSASRSMRQICDTITVRTLEGEEVSLWDWAQSFRSENDIKKCLLYGWVWRLLVRSRISLSDRELFEARGIPMTEWLKTSMLDSVGYNRVSRNDLLFFSSNGYSDTTKESMLDSTFWRMLRNPKMPSRFRFPKIHNVVTKRLLDMYPGLWDDQNTLIISDQESDLSVYREDVVFPILGDGESKKVVVIEELDSFDLGGLPRGYASDKQKYDAVTSQTFLKNLKTHINNEIHAHTNPLCSHIDFFDMFDVSLYIKIGSGVYTVYGVINVRPQDISPMGVDYWADT